MFVQDDLGARNLAEPPLRLRTVEQGFAELTLFERQGMPAFINTSVQDLMNGR